MICNDPVAKAKRHELLLQLREALTKIHTDPFIINQVFRIFRLFHSNMPIPLIPITEANTFFEHLKIRFMNQVIDCGVDNIISGVITDYVSSIQDQYIDDNGLGHTTHVITWSRQFIRLIMDYTNDIWLFRCSVLHGQDKVHRDTVVRNQAVDLLMKLRRDPYKLPHGSRDLAIRSRSKIMSSELSSVLNWISRVSNALDIQSKNLRLGRQDIRDWLKTGTPYERSRTHRDGFYVTGCTVEYDSDITIDFF